MTSVNIYMGTLFKLYFFIHYLLFLNLLLFFFNLKDLFGFVFCVVIFVFIWTSGELVWGVRMKKETEKNRVKDTCAPSFKENFWKQQCGTLSCVPFSRTESSGRKGRLGWVVFIQGGLMHSRISFTVEKKENQYWVIASSLWHCY